MSKFFKAVFIILSIFILIYFLGPKPGEPDLNPEVPILNLTIANVESYVNSKEASIPHLKSGNRARILWSDSSQNKTQYALLYLHGYSASEKEGAPIHEDFAQRYGLNTYLARLHGHGLENGYAMTDLTPENYLASAKEALAIARVLGDSVIIMSTSTGGTLALYLAAFHKDISGLICYSPNIRVSDPAAFLLNDPWGAQIAEMVIGSDTYSWEGDLNTKAYWTTNYPISALVSLQNLVEATMTTKVFQMVDQPLFLGYYYKNEEEQDKVVSVEKQLWMFDNIQSGATKKVKMAFPMAGHHVIASKYKSGDLEGVRNATFTFADSVLGLTLAQY